MSIFEKGSQLNEDSKELKIMTVDDAVAQIEDNMVLGIGTGSTIELLIQAR